MDTLFMLIFTSGTSGDPKAVQVAHVKVIFPGANLVERFSVTADDVCYVSMPLFHSNAVMAGWRSRSLLARRWRRPRVLGQRGSSPTCAATARRT